MYVLRLRILRLVGTMGCDLNWHRRQSIYSRGVEEVVDFPRGFTMLLQDELGMVEAPLLGMWSRAAMEMVSLSWRWMWTRESRQVAEVLETTFSPLLPRIEAQRQNRREMPLSLPCQTLRPGFHHHSLIRMSTTCTPMEETHHCPQQQPKITLLLAESAKPSSFPCRVWAAPPPPSYPADERLTLSPAMTPLATLWRVCLCTPKLHRMWSFRWG
mmetsp:Transcript_39463/g.71033  ORF Transcript_39463/g.71033 Transcript_39463/m.71033 type:complete len:214 (-) Transcript_39463:2634-3275(-)